MHIHVRFVGLIAAGALLCAGLGCGVSGPERAPIRGQVQLAGLPLKHGRILFAPLAPNKGPVSSAIVIDGKYELPSQDGPVIGQNRVQVEAIPDLGFALDDEAAYAKRGGQPLPPDPIPPEFGSQSQLTYQVVAGQPNQFDVVIPQVARRW